MTTIRPTTNFADVRGNGWRKNRTYAVSDDRAERMIADGIAARVLTPVESACELMEAAGCGLVIVDENRAPGMLVDVARARGLKVVKLRSVHSMNSRAAKH